VELARTVNPASDGASGLQANKAIAWTISVQLDNGSALYRLGLDVTAAFGESDESSGDLDGVLPPVTNGTTPIC
jgi:hypothetical protein